MMIRCRTVITSPQDMLEHKNALREKSYHVVMASDVVPVLERLVLAASKDKAAKDGELSSQDETVLKKQKSAGSVLP